MRGYLPALELGTHRLPGDQITHRVAIVQRVHQIANLGGFPDKRALKLRYCDFVTAHIGQNLTDCGLFNFVLRHTSSFPTFLLSVKRSARSIVISQSHLLSNALPCSIDPLCQIRNASRVTTLKTILKHTVEDTT